MCIAFWKLSEGGGSHGCRDFVLAFNRDEFLDRPTKGFHAWPRHPNIYAPQDLKPPDESHRGSWLGVSRQGRLALLTNFREAVPHHDGKISRGALVRDFLLDQPVTPGGQEIEGEEVTVEYARRVFEERQKYDGFNLVLFDLRPGRRQAVYVTNRGSEVGPDGTPGSLKVLSAGEVVGLSNSTIDNPWPKVLKGKRAVTQVLEDTQDGEIGDQTSDSADEQLISSLLSIMRNPEPFSQESPPQCLDDLAECIFVPKINGLNGQLAAGDYGTRTTDVLILRGHKLTVAECNHHQAPESGRVRTSHLTLASQ